MVASDLYALKRLWLKEDSLKTLEKEGEKRSHTIYE